MMCRLLVLSQGSVLSPFHGGDHDLQGMPNVGDFVSVKDHDDKGPIWFKVVCVLHELWKDGNPVSIIVEKAEGDAPRTWGFSEI